MQPKSRVLHVRRRSTGPRPIKIDFLVWVDGWHFVGILWTDHSVLCTCPPPPPHTHTHTLLGVIIGTHKVRIVFWFREVFMSMKYESNELRTVFIEDTFRLWLESCHLSVSLRTKQKTKPGVE